MHFLKEKIKNFIKKIIYSENDRNIFHLGSSHFNLVRKNYSNVKNLFEVDYKIFSQNGEDGIIDYLIYNLNLEKPTFLEIGVGDYAESNTRFLFERYNSKGAIVDKINNFQKKVSKHIKLWRGDLKLIETSISCENINNIIYDSGVSKNLDIFSIDIDGIDYWIIDKIPKKISKIFVAEYNPIFGAKKKITVPNLKDFDRTKYHFSNLCYGMSLSALIEIMKKKEFTFLGTNIACNNAFFISNDYLSNINIELPDIQKLDKFINNNFRESRDKKYKLNYLSGEERIKDISSCKVINLSNSSREPEYIKDIFNL